MSRPGWISRAIEITEARKQMTDERDYVHPCTNIFELTCNGSSFFSVCIIYSFIISLIIIFKIMNIAPFTCHSILSFVLSHPANRSFTILAIDRA